MMRIVNLLVVGVFIFAGCNSQTTSKSDDTAGEKTPKAEMAAAEVPSGEPENLTKQKFLDEIMDYENNPEEWNYKGELPGLVDFYADWCRPCRITSPILAQLAEEYAGQIKVYKVNVDKEKELAAVFGIQSIPTFLFIPKGDNPVMSAGIAQTPEETKAMFKQQIEEILLDKKN